METSTVRQIIEQIQTAVAEVVALRGNVFEVYDVESMADLSKDLQPPCVGVMLISELPTNTATQSQSRNTEVRVGVFIITGRSANKAGGTVLDGLDLNDDVFKKISELISPVGKKYRFAGTIPQDIPNGLAYIQTWTLTVMHC